MQKTFKSAFSILAMLLVWTSAAVPADDKPKDTLPPIEPAKVDLGRPVDYQRDIAPIFDSKCVACHNTIVSESKLVLEDAESILKGGKRGPAVVPKEPEKSRLFLFASRSQKPAMPPIPNEADAKPLTPQELGLLKQWILEGAAGGDGAAKTVVQWQPIPAGVHPIYSTALSPWGRFAAAGRANRIHVYNLITGEEAAELVDPNLLALKQDDKPMYPQSVAHRDFVHSLAFRPDGEMLASGGYRVVKLWQRLRNVQTHQFSATGPVTAVALRADGKLAAVGSADGKIQLVNLEDGKPVKTLEGHTGQVTALEFRPTIQQQLQLEKQLADAETAVRNAARKLMDARQAEQDGPKNVQQLNAEQIEQKKKELTAASEAAAKAFADAQSAAKAAADARAAFDKQAADASQLFSASLDKSIRVWSVSEGKALRTISTTAPVNAFTLNQDTTQIITAEADNSIRVWSLAEQAPAKQAQTNEQKKPEGGDTAVKPVLEIKGHGQAVTSVDLILPAGSQIVSGSADGTVRIWNLSDGKQVRSMNHGGPVTAVAARPDGQMVASAGENSVAKLWQTNDGKQVAEIKGDLYAQGRVADLNQDKTIADQKVSLADAAVKEREKRLKDRQDAANKAKEAKDAAEKALADAQKAEKEAAEKLAAAKKELEQKPDDAGLKKKVQDAQAAADKASDAVKKANGDLASANRAFQVAEKVLKDVQQQLQQAKTELEADQARQKQVQTDLAAAQKADQEAAKPVRSVEFSPDGKRLFTAGDDSTIHAWDANTGRALESFSGHQAPVGTLAVGIEGTLVSGAADKAAIVWDTRAKWKLVGQLGPKPDAPLDVGPSPFVDRVQALDFSPDGKLLATGGGDPSRSGELMIWDVEKQSLVRNIKDAHSDTVLGVEFSSDGKLLLSGGTDKFVKIFEVATGNHVRSFEGHTHHVLDVTWKADGGTIASASADNTIKIWNVETGEQQRTISNYSKQVTSIQFVGTTDDIISCGGDQTVRFHRTANGQNFRNFGGGTDYMYSAAASRDEAVVVAGGEDGVFRVWNGQNGQSLMTFPPPEPRVNLDELQASLAGPGKTGQ